MKVNLMARILVIVLMTFFSIGLVHSEEAADKSHAEHHPEAKVEAGKTEEMKMDDKMDMDKMHAMMNDCMEMHKDKKMCNKDMMENCQKDMNKKDCQKMMKKMKHSPKKK